MASQNISNRLTETCARCGRDYPEGTRFCPTDNSELLMIMVDPLIGTVLPRRYRILSLLGRGSMSVVYKGTYEPLDQLVAIKILKSHLASEISSTSRFQQEIKMAGRLNHPNIVGLLDFGLTQQQVPYLVMEYLEGNSLAEVLNREKRLPVNRVVKIFKQCAEALAYAHETFGIVHRDIKPSNIVLVNSAEEKDLVKVVDFGIAKVQTRPNLRAVSNDESPEALTAVGELIGTPLYMSPEQCMGKELDGRSDIYALGCVMYQALTGKPPLVGDNIIETIRLQVGATPQAIELACPDLYFPERMQQLVMRCLAKDPRMRFQRMEHLASELESCLKKTDSATPSSSYRTINSGNSTTSSINLTTPSASYRAISSSVTLPAIPAIQDSKPERDLQISLPWLCGIIGVVIAITTIGWAVLTDMGKKSIVKMPVPADMDWKNTCTEAQADFAAGNYAQAETEYKEAVEVAKGFPKPDRRLADTLNHLAFVYDCEDKIDAAKRCSEDAEAVEHDLKPADASLTADTMLNLCRINCQLGNLDVADRYGHKALNLRGQEPAKDEKESAAAMQALAQVACKRNDYNRANELLTMALSDASKGANKDNIDVASILHDLGMVREKQGNLKGAEQAFTKALGIRQKELGVDHPQVADTLCALGTLNFNIHKDEEAEQILNTALSIREKSFGEESSRTAEVYSCLAILYDSEHKSEKAEECYRKALEIREKIWGPNNPRLLRTLQNLEKFLREHNQPKGAEVYEARIKQIQDFMNQD